VSWATLFIRRDRPVGKEIEIGFVFSTLPNGLGRSNNWLGSFFQSHLGPPELGSLRKATGGRESVSQKTPFVRLFRQRVDTGLCNMMRR
jgi:hypothetical protein